jgi:hypothetical protein
MRLFVLAAAVAALLVPAGPAFAAGDPIMPLWQVHAGMRCTGYSVIHGTDISSFAVDVLEVTGGEAEVGGGRILIHASGPAVDATGLGPGFSGSPIYCPDGAGVSRVIGAISESVNAYGGKEALATPIEAILGTPVDVPGKPSARMRAALKSARPLVAPLTVSGLSTPVAQALETAAAKAGRTVLAVPAGPLGTFPVQTLRPGSAVAVGYSTGDVRTSAVGTVVYVDGDKVWLFGHELDGVGRRALLLQDAYVFSVINNPLQVGTAAATYKLAASGHDLGTVSSDGFNAVAGRTGVLPHTVPIHVIARDLDSDGLSVVNTAAADEAAVDLPSGGSWTSFVAPLAVSQAAAGVLGSAPARLTGDMCARIKLAQLAKPLRFCNRYVSTSAGEDDNGTTENAVLSGAANDLGGALATIDAYTGKPPTVTGVNVLLKVRRGADQAFMRSVKLPRRARPGQKVRARVKLQIVRGGTLTRTYTLRIPARAPRGTRHLRFVGQDVDEGGDSFTTIIIGDDSDSAAAGDEGPKTLKALAKQVRATARYDGVIVHDGRVHARAFRDDRYRISGTAEAKIRVTR